MADFNIASMSDLQQVLCNFRDATRQLGQVNLRWDSGAFAIDALGEATAEQLLVALRGLLDEPSAKTVVGILLEAGLTLDATLDEMGGDAGGADAR